MQGFYRMDSPACGGPMRFAVFQPPQSREGRVPAELGLMLVMPDTSPRGTGIEGATNDWEFGEGAGFYLDATQAPWSSRFRMETHVAHELFAAVAGHFPADPARTGIFGHSMGGHGALVLAMRHPDKYRSLSAFAPIVAPSQVPWDEDPLP